MAFPLRRHTQLSDRDVRERATEKLEAVGLGAEYDKMPAALSGGMRKRAGLARALALDPPILLVDEPSAGLDPITADEIDELLLGLKKRGGTTLIVVTHDLASATPARRHPSHAARGAHRRPGHFSGSRTELRSPGAVVHVFAALRVRRLMGRERLAAVGAFVIGGLVLFAAGLFLIGDRRMLFTDTFRVYAEFKQVAALDTGAKVRVAGIDAGEVEEIRVPPGPSGRFRVRMRVRSDLRPLIRTDSIALIQNDGLVGNKFVQIQTGTDAAPAVADDGTIQSREPFDIADLMLAMSDTLATVNTMLVQVKSGVDQALGAVTATATDAQALMKDMGGEVRTILRSADRSARISRPSSATSAPDAGHSESS